MKIPRRGASARLQRKVCEANLAGSYAKAARLLGSLASLPLSSKEVELITERVGRSLAGQRAQGTAAFLDHRTTPPREEPRPLLVISLDGGRVQTRQPAREEKWKEDKIGVVYEATPAPERPGEDYAGPPARQRSITATMGTWEELGDHLSALADRRGYARAVKKVCISDGAGSIAAQRQRCFPDAVFILDHTHAVEHLHQAAQAAFGTGDQAAAWWERQKDRLWNGQLDALLGELGRQSRRRGLPPKKAPETDPRRILAQNVHYFQTNRAGLDYPRFRRHGWPIGSGIVESTIKQLGHRVKGSEKHWSLPGAEATLQVMTHLLAEDGSWIDYWKRCPLAA